MMGLPSDTHNALLFPVGRKTGLIFSVAFSEKEN
jgi:hypothetical protein